MSNTQKFLVPLIAVIAIAGIGLGGAALATRPSTTTLTTQLRSLRQDLATADKSLATADKSITALQSSSAQAATSGNVSKLQSQLASLKMCIPQLQQEVGNLGISSSTQNGWLTSASIQNSTIISSDCSKTLYGSNG